MPFSIAEHFAKAHGGFDGLLKLTELINSDNSLDDIADKLHLSAAQICRLREKLFDRVWTPKRGLLEYIEFQRHCLEREIARRDEYIKQEEKLRFVQGGLDGQHRS